MARPDAIDRDRIADLVDTGLRNLWYPIAPSWMVRAAPAGFTRLGLHLVAWRNAEGGVHVLEDRCPHRGARLSLGWNRGDRIACWYHGVEVGPDGSVLKVPAVPGCPMEGRHYLQAYPSVERNGAIFTWFGDAAHPEPAPLDLPEQLADPDWSSFLCTAHWRCNYRYAAENVMDPMHGAYLHAVSHSMAAGAKTATMRARDTATGFVFEKTDQAGVNFDWTEFGDTGGHWLRLEIPYGRAAGPGGPFSIIGFVTPVDRQSCRVFFWRCRKVQGWQRDAWRFLYRAHFEGLHWNVLEQDRAMLEAMPNDARERETLYQHDAGLMKLRRVWNARARAQLAEE